MPNKLQKLSTDNCRTFFKKNLAAEETDCCIQIVNRKLQGMIWSSFSLYKYN